MEDSVVPVEFLVRIDCQVSRLNFSSMLIAQLLLRVDDYDFNIANCASCVLGIEDKRSMEKELGPILEHLSITLSLNPSSLYYEVSLEELKSFVGFLCFSCELNG
ncbi:hypothetical protein M9H77_30982 [Catharanthus roseus]|uniref:Uncharacterized protein n=1 Tax=Catharanthus roseus TaxID=4058 RepID=A0ACC0A0M3_CATRO|nr:hypothetical protein M9H77_30982 [Catharanthus roseus]